jgi:amino acid transporter
MSSVSKKISLVLLVLLIVSAIDSIRNLPSAALFGSSLIFFFILASLVFLLPTALVSAELASLLPDKGGIYHWMTKAFGEKVGMLSIWLQWINTMVWYPTILSFIAGIGAYLIKPELANNKVYLIISIIVIFWTLTYVNLFGVNVSAKINSVAGLVGTIFPLCLLIFLGIIWVYRRQPLQLSFSFSSLLPNFSSIDNWVSLTAIISSFLGIELAGVHVNDIKNPQKNFPKALFISAFILLTTMLFGSLAIAIVVPSTQINLVAGVMQVFSVFFESLHVGFLTPILAVLIVIGSLGSIINWLISPAKGLYHAAEFGFLPDFFKKKNKYGVASRILISQAILVSALCCIFFLVPNVNSFYWFLTGLSTDLYLLMYLLMFIGAIKLHYVYKHRDPSFKIPGKSMGLWITCLLGIFGCLLTLFISFFPPQELQIPITRYAFLILIGNIIMISPIFLFYFYKKIKKN